MKGVKYPAMLLLAVVLNCCRRVHVSARSGEKTYDIEALILTTACDLMNRPNPMRTRNHPKANACKGSAELTT